MTLKGAAFAPSQSRAAAQRALMQSFAAAGLAAPGLDARLLLCAALGLDHLDLLRDPDIALGAAAATVTRLAQRRLAGEPVSRILGRREFYGLEFGVSPAVLDPRPDTEILVDTARAALAPHSDRPLRLLDLGTGSGAILAALLTHLPSAFGVGVDRSEAACRAARENLARLGLAGCSAIVCADWAAPFRGSFDGIVSNPPYIRSVEIAGLAPEVRDHDPLAALDGGGDGLDAYRALVPALADLAVPGGFVALEIGLGQAESVMELIAGTGAFQAIDVAKDLAGHVRVVTALRRLETGAEACVVSGQRRDISAT